MDEEYKPFKLVAPYQPTGDQPQAIAKLTEGVLKGYREQAMLGVTGSGKTFTMANIIQNLNRPTLVLAHNKTLAAQLLSLIHICGGGGFFAQNDRGRPAQRRPGAADKRLFFGEGLAQLPTGGVQGKI